MPATDLYASYRGSLSLKNHLRLCVLSLALAVACGGRPDSGRDPAPGGDASAVALEQSAHQVVGFLRGAVPFDSLAMADTIELRVAPEGGGATRRVQRSELRDPAAWTIGDGARRIHLIPPAEYLETAMAAGRHYRCREQALAPVAPDWAHRPHVGVRLQPGNAASCLQTWNATFIFDTLGGRPRLAGVLYDQWEW